MREFCKFKKVGAFTLVELLVAAVVLGIITAVAVPAVRAIKADSQQVADSASLRSLNEAATRARLEGINNGVGAGVQGNDKAAALAWYISNKVIASSPVSSISRLTYLNGKWFTAPWKSTAEMLAELRPVQSNAAQLAWMVDNEFTTTPQFLAQNGLPTNLTADQLFATYGPQMDSLIASYESRYGPSPNNRYVVSRVYGNPAKIAALLNSFSALSMPELKGVTNILSQTAISDPNSGVTPDDYIQAWVAVQKAGNPNLPASQLADGAGYALQRGFAANVLDGVDLSGLDLTGQYFNGFNLSKTNLTIQQLASLNNSGLTAANLSGRNLSGINFSDKILQAVNLSGSNLAGAVVTSETDFRNGNLSGATGDIGALLTASSPYIFGINLSGVDLTGFQAAGKFISSQSFVGATGITGQNLSNAENYQSSNLSGINLTGFNNNKKSLYRVTMPSNANTPSTFQAVTGQTAAQLRGTQWTDGSYPWGN